MVVACFCWVSRAHGVKDVGGGFFMSMRRRRRKELCFRCGSPEFLVEEGRWVEGSRPVGSHFDWRKEAVKGSLVHRSWHLVVRWFMDCFPLEWAGFRWVWSLAGKWVMVAVKTEKIGSFRGGCLVAGQQRGEERQVRKMGKQRLKLLLLPCHDPISRVMMTPTIPYQ
ncbi:hypothetical protein KY290_031942 [Solanum tuberosum]|uniref:Uncharacterized protein n=1 Tax=Solanum tuberosum TaxID=4113 RepID=A0ABQ7UAP3_SOLTU|nr:hypothetical protein KY290_031942 [Solanum tuberosum]